MLTRLNEVKIGRGYRGTASSPALIPRNCLGSVPPPAPDSPSKRRIAFTKLSDGERLPMLIESSGLPNWYATLFITTQARNAAKAPNTMLAMLSAIRSLLAWAESNGMRLEDRFVEQHFLKEPELESLRTFAQAHLSSTALANSDVAVVSRLCEGARARLRKADDRVSSCTHYIRLTYIAQYLDWLAVRLVERDGRGVHDSTLESIRTMTRNLRIRRPRKRSPSRLSARAGLLLQEQERLLDIVRPDSTVNPFRPSLRKRNELVVLLLYHLGVRAGELLAIKVSDFDFQRNDVVIPRRHGDVTDPRKDQPVVKTMDRRIPVSHTLAGAVFDYIMIERRRLPAAKRHAFLIVVHQGGPFEGEPLSMKGFLKIFVTLQRTDPNLLGRLTAHALRHTANDNFSELMDKLKVPEATEEKMRSYLMGWKEGSGTAATYTRRHIEKSAREASLKLQRGWQRGGAIGKE